MNNLTRIVTQNTIRFIIHTDTNRIADTMDNTSNFSSIEPYVVVLVFMCLAAVAVPFIITPNNTTYEMNTIPSEAIEMNDLERNQVIRAETPELPIQTRDINTGEVLTNPNPIEDLESGPWEDIPL